MTTCLGKNCSFGLLCVSFVKVYQSLCVCPSFPVDTEGVMWAVIIAFLVTFHEILCYSMFPYLTLPQNCQGHPKVII